MPRDVASHELTSEQYAQLQAALVAAFDDAGLKLLCAVELEEDFDAIVPAGPRQMRVFELITWAKKYGRVVDLVAGALRQNPTHAAVRKLALDAMTWPVCADAGDTLFITDKLLPRHVAEAYLAALVQKYAKWLERYTPLAGIAEVQAKTAQPTLVFDDVFMPIGFEKLVEHGFGPEKRVERVEVNDLRDAVTDYRRIVVLGEPGSGKTTTLWRLLYDDAHTAQGKANAPLPIFVPLGGYTGPESALAYAAKFAGELGLHLPAYLAQGRAVLLLDALNEMPREGYKERVGRVQALLDRYPDATVVVTCRALDYVETLKLEKVDVKPLDVFRQREYLHRYLGEAQGDRLFWQMAGGEAVEDLWKAWQALGRDFVQLWKGKELPDDVRWKLTYFQRNAWKTLHGDSLPPLLALGVNPFLLVMFAQVFASKGTLPQNRGNLFAAFVDALVAREQNRHAPGTLPGETVLKSALANLAYWMQKAISQGTTIEQSWLMAQAHYRLEADSPTVDDLLRFGQSASLLDISGGYVGFAHQLLQEYFAALAWKHRFDVGDDLRQYWPDGWATPTGWEETAVLLAGMLPDMTAFVEQLVPVNPALAARCICESGGVQPGNATLAMIRTALVAIVTSLSASVKERTAAGTALNFVGDPRDLEEMIVVPSGKFIMGSDRYDDEKPQREVYVADFRIGKYPVTNQQYEKFVAATDYAPPPHWRGKTPPREVANHPVTYVSWHDACAYCAWLSEVRGEEVRLPTEAEWEKAARGTDGRQYPWGETPDPSRANFVNTHIDGTTTVGSFPDGASPYGCFDVAGNVLEWTSSIYQPYELDAEDDRENVRVEAIRTLRGGSWSFDDYAIRCPYRSYGQGDNRGNSVGFRVVAT